MIRLFFTGLMGLLMLLGGALAATPASKGSFSNALRESRIGSNPVQAYFLVRMLKDTDAPADEVEALRRELLHAYLEQLDTPSSAQPTPKDTVAAAIARGRSRSSVLDSEFSGAWQRAFGKGLGIRWHAPADAMPYFATVNRSMQPVATGVWAAESSSGNTYFTLAMRLINTSKLPLPIHRPDMVWGGEAGTGRGGLAFSCNWDGVPPPEGNIKADEVELLEPGAESRLMFCEAAPVGAYWKGRLLQLVEAAQQGGVQPQIFSHEFDSQRKLLILEIALGNAAAQSGEWRKRYQVSQQEVGRRWNPSLQPLEAPFAQKWTWSPNEGWSIAWQKLKLFLGGTLFTLVLFGAGRALLRAGVPEVAVGVGTLAGLGSLFAIGLEGVILGSGGGYVSPLYTGLALYAVVVGPMMFAILALYWLHKVLDAEDLSWWQTVALGWRRAADIHSFTSRAEFWGFFAQIVWWWGLVNVCLKPLHLWVGGILLYPLLSLSIRRFRSMTGAEILGVVVTVVCMVLLVLA